MTKYKVAIVGTGPAGYAAATYTSRAELTTTLFAGPEPGGQLTKTTEVENYPGFAKGIMGPQLMNEMQGQATRFGAEIIWETVTTISVSTDQQTNGKFQITTDGGKTYAYDAVILTMGASSRLLGVGEDRYWGKGFSTCAVCDAAFYKGKDVYVVGGGDAAVEDALALTKFASHVTMLVRGTELRASKIMQARVLNNPQITIRWKTNLKAISGETVSELLLEIEGKKETVITDGLFYAIGHEPATGFLKNTNVALDEKGYIKTAFNYPEGKNWLEIYPTMTSVPGVFAAGDCVDFRYRQAATASGMGVAAALDAEKWLENNL